MLAAHLQARSRSMSTFVLVHGAWGGAHGFRHLRRGLQAAGHEVFTPSLTGIGERVHLASPLVNLSTHIRDVVHQVLYEDLQDIVLLGFSYGGFVVTGSLEHIAARVQHLVYLDAFVPGQGDSVWGQIRGTGRTGITLGEEWLVGGPVREFDDPAESAWMAPRRTLHPRGCFTEPVFLAQPLESYPFTRSYIKATASPPEDPGNAAFWRAARHAQSSPAWHYHEIDSNHMVANNRPAELAALLLGLVRAD
jgi:pimeloyl-ACP methyl ester carboxylesterase